MGTAIFLFRFLAIRVEREEVKEGASEVGVVGRARAGGWMEGDSCGVRGGGEGGGRRKRGGRGRRLE